MITEDILKQIGKDLVLQLRNELMRSGKSNTGKLKNGIKFKVRKLKNETWELVIIDTAGYFDYVDEGVKGTKTTYPKSSKSPYKYGTKKQMPPPKKLKNWVQKKLNVNRDEVDGVSFAVARSIGYHGIEGIHIVKKCLEMIMKKWKKKIGEAAAADITANIKNAIKELNFGKK